MKYFIIVFVAFFAVQVFAFPVEKIPTIDQVAPSNTTETTPQKPKAESHSFFDGITGLFGIFDMIKSLFGGASKPVSNSDEKLNSTVPDIPSASEVPAVVKEEIQKPVDSTVFLNLAAQPAAPAEVKEEAQQPSEISAATSDENPATQTEEEAQKPTETPATNSVEDPATQAADAPVEVEEQTQKPVETPATDSVENPATQTEEEAQKPVEIPATNSVDDPATQAAAAPIEVEEEAQKQVEIPATIETPVTALAENPATQTEEEAQKPVEIPATIETPVTALAENPATQTEEEAQKPADTPATNSVEDPATQATVAVAAPVEVKEDIQSLVGFPVSEVEPPKTAVESPSSLVGFPTDDGNDPNPDKIETQIPAPETIKTEFTPAA